jgi:peptide/nickel transport system permease protein
MKIEDDPGAEVSPPTESGEALADAGLAVVSPPLATPIPDGGAAGALDVSVRRIRREHLSELLHSKAFLIGAGILCFWIICAIFGTLFAPYSATAPALGLPNSAPSAAHWFGTDSLGRDVFSRVIVGARDILEIAPLSTLLGTVVGTAIGLAQGYLRGVFDLVVGRIVDATLALPTVIVAFLFVVAVGPSTLTLVLVIGFVFALIIARTVRAAVLQERELDYLAAARLRGESSINIMFVEILPNVFGPIIVEFTVRLGYAIFTIATLSFLGFGVEPPTPDWGADIAANYQYLAAGYWWETLFPALAIASLVIGINLMGDSIEAVLLQ